MLPESTAPEIIGSYLGEAGIGRLVCDSPARDRLRVCRAGVATAEVGLDLLVLNDDVADARQESFRLRDACFEEIKHVIGGIAYPAHKYGRIIHEAA